MSNNYCINIKNQFGDRALSLFIAPPSIETLRQRLIHRSTDSPEMIEKRVEKAQYEMSFAPQFDMIIVNDKLDKAVEQAADAISTFISE